MGEHWILGTLYHSPEMHSQTVIVRPLLVSFASVCAGVSLTIAVVSF